MPRPGDIEASSALAAPRHSARLYCATSPMWHSHEDRLPDQCNCSETCRTINSLRNQGRISAQEWYNWHMGLRNAASSTIEEDNEDIMSNEFNIHACARCAIKLTRTNRARGKLEVPVSHNNQKLERLCKNCASGYYITARYNLANLRGEFDEKKFRLISSNYITLRDTGDSVSSAFTSMHCFRSLVIPRPAYWFLTAANRDSWDLREARNGSQSLDIYRRQGLYRFGYHETNNISLFRWPSITPHDSLCFGVELEMENRKDADSSGGVKLSLALGGRLDDPKNRFILASDGSLNASGLELITNPYTLEYHANVFGWRELLAPAIKVGACAGSHTTRCGIHVHVNRSAISPLTLGKALIFVNADNNRALIERIAQRPSNNYTQLRTKKLADGHIPTTGKYEAMHLTENTVEFRIFRGNLRADRILKNIEFCHSVFSYVATISAQACQEFAPYLKFLTENAKLYPNLVAFLREKDTIAIRKGAQQIQITEEI